MACSERSSLIGTCGSESIASKPASQHSSTAAQKHTSTRGHTRSHQTTSIQQPARRESISPTTQDPNPKDINSFPHALLVFPSVPIVSSSALPRSFVACGVVLVDCRTLEALCMYFLCTLYALCMYTVCTLYVHCMYTVCTLEWT